MERVSAQGRPEKTLTHLLNRSGLLQQHADDTYQFIHRTFQDYLTAKEFVEDDHLDELLRHADEETWQDVILLAAGHCGRRELAVLVSGLLDVGLRYEAGTEERTAVHVLAALCAQHATWLDEAVRRAVRESTAALFPPTDDSQVASLARLGPAALAFLPDPRTMSTPKPDTWFVTSLITDIGGAPAIPHARAWALAHPWLGRAFASKWERFPQRLPLGTPTCRRGIRTHHRGTFRAGPDRDGDLRMLRPLFPGVRHLRPDVSARRVLDLTPLHSWPGLQVQVLGLTRQHLIGAEELGNRLNASPG